MPDDLTARGVENRDFALPNRDERIRTVTDAIQHLADIGGPVLTKLGQSRQLGPTASGSAAGRQRSPSLPSTPTYPPGMDDDNSVSTTLPACEHG